MRDQAELLREMMNQSRHVPVAEAAGPPVLVIGSGKGGVGKSLMAIMLGSALAVDGRRVLLLDGEQNMGNLHVLLGIQPTVHLEDLLTGATSPASLVRLVSGTLSLLPSDSGAEALHRLGPTDRARLHYRLSTLYDDFDLVIIDAGSGIESVVRASTMRATRLVVVTAPQPAALTDAYALIKVVSQEIRALPVDVLVNLTRDEAEGRATYERMATATERFLRRGVRYLGSMPEHSAVRAAACDPERLLACHATEPMATSLGTIIERFALPPSMKLVGTGPLREQE